MITGTAQIDNGTISQAAQNFGQTISNGIPGTSYTVTNVNTQYTGQTYDDDHDDDDDD